MRQFSIRGAILVFAGLWAASGFAQMTSQSVNQEHTDQFAARPSDTVASDGSGAGGGVPKSAEKPRVPAGPVSDTVLSPLGGYGIAPPPERGPYDGPDFAPITRLNNQVPRWIQFSLEERFRWEGYSGGSFKPDNSDYYALNRLRFGMTIRPASWLKRIDPRLLDCSIEPLLGT